MSNRPQQTNPERLAAQVQAIQQLAQVCTSYYINVEPDVALAYIKTTPQCNDYDPHTVARFIQRVNDYIPKMDFGGTNPNNGKYTHTWCIAREGSECLYVVIRKAYLPKDYNYAALSNVLKGMGQTAKAQECWCSNDEAYPGDYEFRFWWD